MGLLCSALLALAPSDGATASEPAPLLPDLVADAPDNVALATSSEEGRTRLLLRFNGYIHNAGPGALDMRATRSAPTVKGLSPTQLQEEVETYRFREETLPVNVEEELASPRMAVDQRLFTTEAGDPVNSQEYLQRPHVEHASAAELAYSNADGHHHWHLQHVVSYSLWNAARTAEVAPSQKVGFCLEDVQHVELGKGPATPVYSDKAAPGTSFCRRWEPNATSLYEGISPGWRDVYDRELAFQWVDVSDVAPGEYWLREDIDPTGVIDQAPGGTKTEYSAAAVTVPGFDAVPQSLATSEDAPAQATLGARAFGDGAVPAYAIAAAPEHGTLSAVEGEKVTYTPDPGYAGSDSFTYSARDPDSPFPEHPALATVTVTVASERPAIAIAGAPAAIKAGTSIDLEAQVSNDSGAVEWEASSGVVRASGGEGREATYTAPASPPVGGSVSIVARLADDRSTSETQSVTIEAPEEPEPAPEPPVEPPPVQPPPVELSPPGPKPAEHVDPVRRGASSSSTPGESGRSGTGLPATSPPSIPGPAPAAAQPATRAGISRPRALLAGRELVISTVATLAGSIRLTAYHSGHELGSCASVTPAGRAFTCRIALARGVSLRARIAVSATLRAGRRHLSVSLPAQVVPEMRMPGAQTSAAHEAAGTLSLWCSASMLTP